MGDAKPLPEPAFNTREEREEQEEREAYRRGYRHANWERQPETKGEDPYRLNLSSNNQDEMRAFSYGYEDSNQDHAAGAQRRPPPATRDTHRGHRAHQPQVRSDLHRLRHARPQETRSQDQRPPNSIGVSASRKADRTQRPLVRVTAPSRQQPIEPVTNNTIVVTDIAAKTHIITIRNATRNQIPYLNNPTP